MSSHFIEIGLHPQVLEFTMNIHWTHIMSTFAELVRYSTNSSKSPWLSQGNNPGWVEQRKIYFIQFSCNQFNIHINHFPLLSINICFQSFIEVYYYSKKLDNISIFSSNEWVFQLLFSEEFYFNQRFVVKRK